MIDQAAAEKSIFIKALELTTPSQREAYVQEACADDAQLLERVLHLLDQHDRSQGPLDAPAPRIDATAEASSVSELPGTQIGPYKIREQIGEGGFGVVYVAEQREPVSRKVALKIIKPGMDTKDVIARFEAERQALALMDHPNIAKVLDAGATDSGRPYFVMELVSGAPITEFCDHQKLSSHQRLELFVDVCRAIQHAHQKGIIHRDVKPSNVMVTMHDDKPVVKVIDFGVAKALSSKLTEKSIYTAHGQMIGTPLYMSPEQALLSGLDVDTRSDVYSLGVLLYALLTGTTPFDRETLKQAGLDEMCRMIREEEPPRPSNRLSTLNAEALSTISDRRGIDPRKLGASLRGELDWIVMKALEKDRNRRYESPSEFAADVGRHLNNEPVLARPTTLLYRFRKFAGRRKRTLVTVSVIAAAVFLGMASIGWAVRDRAARSQQAARERAERQSRLVGKVGAILEEVDRLMREKKWGEALTAAMKADAALESGEANEQTRRRVKQVLSDLQLVQRLENARLARSVWTNDGFDHAAGDRAYSTAFRRYDIENRSAEEVAESLRSRISIVVPLALALDDWADVKRSMPKSNEANWQKLVAIAKLLDPSSLRNRLRSLWGRRISASIQKELMALADTPGLAGQRPATLQLLARTLKRVGLADEAISVLRLAQQIYPADFWINFLLAESLDKLDRIRFYSVASGLRPGNTAVHNNLGIALVDQGKPDDAIACYKKALQIDPNHTAAHLNFGSALKSQGKLDDAIVCYNKAIEIDPELAMAHLSLGTALKAQGKLDEAIACYKKAIELDPKLTRAHSNLGSALQDQGKLDEAIACYKKALELDPKHTMAHNNLGDALAVQGKLDEAIAHLKKAIELDPELAAPHNNLGNALKDQGKLDEAIASYRKAIEVDPNFAFAHNNLGNALKGRRKLDEAIAYFKKAIELDPKLAAPRNDLGNALKDQGKLDEAIACYKKAIKIDPNYAAAHDNLGTALAFQGKLNEAIACWTKTIKIDASYANAHNKLGTALVAQGKLDEAIACYKKAVELNPNYAGAHNVIAWYLATCSDPEYRDAKQAVFHASRAVALSPTQGNYWNTLGVALYRAGDWSEASKALKKSMELRRGGDASDWLFLAMAQWQLGDKEAAQRWHQKSIEWMEKNNSDNEELLRFRAEAEKLLGIETGSPKPEGDASATTEDEPKSDR